MAIKIISDSFGNQRRVSDSPDSTNLVLNVNKRINKIIQETENNNNNQNNQNQYDEDLQFNDQKLHICSKSLSTCQEKEDGSMWLYIGPYKGRINFCPYCGYKAREQTSIKI